MRGEVVRLVRMVFDSARDTFAGDARKISQSRQIAPWRKLILQEEVLYITR